MAFSGATFDGQLRVDGGNKTLTFTGSPLELSENNTAFRYDALKLNVVVDKDDRFTVDGSLGKTVMTAPSDDEEASQEQLQWDELTINSQGKSGSFGMNMGQSDVSLKNINISRNGELYSTLTGLTFSSSAQENGKFINQTVDIALDALSVEGKNLGSGSAKIKLDNFDGKSLQYFNRNSSNLIYMIYGGGTNPVPVQEMNANLMSFLGAIQLSVSLPLSGKTIKARANWMRQLR